MLRPPSLAPTLAVNLSPCSGLKYSMVTGISRCLNSFSYIPISSSQRVLGSAIRDILGKKFCSDIKIVLEIIFPGNLFKAIDLAFRTVVVSIFIGLW